MRSSGALRLSRWLACRRRLSSTRRHRPSPRSLPSMPLGVPLPPADQHAISASMPLWSHVVGYEEGDEDIHSALMLGYPRFVYNPITAELFEHLGETLGGPAAVAFSSRSAARRCQAFLERALQSKGVQEPDPEPLASCVHPVGVADVHAVTTAAENAHILKSYWQHTGELISSRFAASILAALHGEPAAAAQSTSGASLGVLKERISAAAGGQPEDTYIFPSGMNAVYNAHLLSHELRQSQGQPLAGSAVFGFPYLDTLKLMSRPELSAAVHFYPHGDEQSGDYAALEATMEAGPMQAIFFEFPTNPLLKICDVHRLATLGARHGTPVIMDDTIGFGNWDSWASDPNGPDMVVSSLSKVFSGVGNAMGGSLVLNKQRPLYERLKELAEAQCSEGSSLYHEDAAVLASNSADLKARCKVIRKTAHELIQHLRAHPEIAEVHAADTPDGLSCGLISIVLRQKHLAPLFYDSLDIAKGPGFGTNFTLGCPYAVLAHYNELEWCRDCGVEPSLVRIWVGLDPCQYLIGIFDKALEKSTNATRLTRHS